jgi:hypothetical protein
MNAKITLLVVVALIAAGLALGQSKRNRAAKEFMRETNDTRAGTLRSMPAGSARAMVNSDERGRAVSCGAHRDRLEQVVGGRKQAEFAAQLGQAAQQELPELASLLDLPKPGSTVILRKR